MVDDPPNNPVNMPPSSAATVLQGARRALNNAELTARRRIHVDSRFSNALGDVNSALNDSEDSSGIELLFDGVSSLTESLPSLAKALDQVAHLHPFVASEQLSLFN